MSSSWAGRRVLVTGHTGFKGAWLALWLDHLGAHVSAFALAPTDAASAYPALGPWPHLDEAVVDLRDGAAVADFVATRDPEVVFHLGAQALVRRGYADPLGTWSVNVLGTANVLEAARSAPSLRAVVVATSDKVYANAGDGRAFREDDPLGGSDPYSSSKAAAELVAGSWRRAFLGGAVGVATARAGNVVGGGDRGEDRLLPDVWRALESSAPVRLRYPGAVRPWQFVLEPLRGYLLLAERLLAEPATAPAAVNFGPEPAGCIPVAAIVDRALACWGSGSWERAAGHQAPEARVLQLDAGLAATTLGWRPVLHLDTALAWTVEWWRMASNGGDLRKLALSQVEAFEERAGW